MAHAEKFTKGAIFGIANHIERKTENHSNEDIDISRTKDNYSLLNDNSDLITRLNNRLDEVHVYNRKDVNVMVDWVVTLPNELKGATQEQQREFFSNTHDFLVNRYGGLKNVVSSEVHVDETTPHLHFAFIPVVFDEKRQQERVQANKVIDRAELRVFHDDLHKYLLEKIPGIYQQGILNDKTIPVSNVAEIKKMDKQIKDEIKIKKETLKEVTAYKNPKKEFDKIIDNSSRSILGLVQLSKEDLSKVSEIVLGAEKSTVIHTNYRKKTDKEIVGLKRENKAYRLALGKEQAKTNNLWLENHSANNELDSLKQDKAQQDKNIRMYGYLTNEDIQETLKSLTPVETETLEILDSMRSKTFKSTRPNLIHAKEVFEKLPATSRLYKTTRQVLEKVKNALDQLAQKVQRSKPRL